MAVLVGRVLEPQWHLPTDVGLPVHRALAGLERGDVQRAPGTLGEPGSVEEDARVVGQPGDRGGRAVVLGAGVEEALRHRFVVELHVTRPETHEVAHHVGDVVLVGEVGAVAAAPLLHLGGVGVEDALAALAVDAPVARAQERRVEHPRALFGGVGAAHPLAHILGLGSSRLGHGAIVRRD